MSIMIAYHSNSWYYTQCPTGYSLCIMIKVVATPRKWTYKTKNRGPKSGLPPSYPSVPLGFLGKNIGLDDSCHIPCICLSRIPSDKFGQPRNNCDMDE